MMWAKYGPWIVPDGISPPWRSLVIWREICSYMRHGYDSNSQANQQWAYWWFLSWPLDIELPLSRWPIFVSIEIRELVRILDLLHFKCCSWHVDHVAWPAAHWVLWLAHWSCNPAIWPWPCQQSFLLWCLPMRHMMWECGDPLAGRE